MYLCQNCGGHMKFDIPSQQLACEFCGTHMDPYAFNQEKGAEEQELYDVTIFTCPQCGGEILSTDTSATGFCSFCGASTILSSRLSKERRPGYIIPFSKTKEDCKKAYSDMMKHAYFAPDELKNEKCIDSFRGIYMPYWAYYISQRGPIRLDGTKSHRKGDYIYTDHYDLSGDLDCYYKGLSYDASSSFSDSISEAIAPYNVKGMKAFTPSYLSGFYADTSDVNCMLYQEDATEHANDETFASIKKSPAFRGFEIENSVKNAASSRLNTACETVDSAMFPVWFMSYRNGDRVAYATVNGQTGKVVADLPIDPKKYLLGSLILALPIFLLLNLFFTFRPTVLLGIAAVLSIIACVIYLVEVFQISHKESGIDDKGILASRGGVPKEKPKFSSFRKVGFIASLAAIVTSALIALFQPVSDLYYYGGAIFVMVAMFFMILDIMYYYNILATRKLPQFDRSGGDDRA